MRKRLKRVAFIAVGLTVLLVSSCAGATDSSQAGGTGSEETETTLGAEELSQIDDNQLEWTDDINRVETTTGEAETTGAAITTQATTVEYNTEGNGGTTAEGTTSGAADILSDSGQQPEDNQAEWTN